MWFLYVNVIIRVTKDTQCENKVFIQNMLGFLNEGRAKQRHANNNTAVPSETATKVNLILKKDHNSPNGPVNVL